MRENLQKFWIEALKGHARRGASGSSDWEEMAITIAARLPKEL